jgi:uncharacterized membrane protein
MRARAEHPPTSVTRLAELGLATLIFLGSCALVAIPLATLYLLSRVSGDYATIYLMALIGCPLALVLWGVVLIRLDRLLGRVRGTPAGQPRAGSALDAGITVAVLIALAAMVLWYVLGDVPGPGPRVFL